jgi:hypothetical protein
MNQGVAVALALRGSTHEAGDGADLCLSLGTGLSGGLIEGDGRLRGGVLELGKVVMATGDGPKHDYLRITGCAQGLAGTQRALFNIFGARGGQHIEDKVELAEEMLALPSGLKERCVLLAWRPCAPTFALALDIAAETCDEHTRANGLKLLFSRAVTVLAGIVGSSQLGLVCQRNSTLESLQRDFTANPEVCRLLEAAYGPFSLRRSSRDNVPDAFRMLPAVPRISMSAPSCASYGVVLGLDFGRSDVKAAVLHAGTMEVLSTADCKWWKGPASSREPGPPHGAEFTDPARFSTIAEHLRVGAYCPGPVTPLA